MFVPILVVGLSLILVPVGKGDTSLSKDALVAGLKNNQGIQYERLND